MLLNKLRYNPIDDNSPTGYRRPPRDPACICDYFSVLGEIEDDGEFSHSEMAAMIDKYSRSYFFAISEPVPDPKGLLEYTQRATPDEDLKRVHEDLEKLRVALVNLSNTTAQLVHTTNNLVMVTGMLSEKAKKGT